jgi:hypothetical protein
MQHYIGINPDLIRDRNGQIRAEISSLRLQERLRKNREPCEATSVGLHRAVEAPSR